MATLKDNITEMSTLVAEIKRDKKLSESTVLRIVEINVSLSLQNRGGSINVNPTDDEDLDGLPEPIPFPVEADGEDIIQPDDSDIIAAATPEEE